MTYAHEVLHCTPDEAMRRVRTSRAWAEIMSYYRLRQAEDESANFRNKYEGER